MVFLLTLGCGASPLREIRTAEDLRAARSPVLSAALRSDDPVLRARAATAMGRIQDPADILPLLQALGREGDGVVRRRMIFSLGQMGFGAARKEQRLRAVQALSEHGKNSDPATRAACVEAIGKLGGAGEIPWIAEYLGDPIASVRGEAALGLFRARWTAVWRGDADRPLPLPRPVVNRLTDASRDRDPDVRWRVAYALRGETAPGAATALISLAADPDPTTRLFAVRALGRIPSKVAQESLRVALRDSVAEVRVEAVQAVGRQKAWGLLSPKLADDPSRHVRGVFAETLGERDAGLGDSLQRLTRDSSRQVRIAAIVSSAKRGALPDHEALLRHAHWRFRAAAAQAIAFRAENRSGLAEVAFRDADHRVRAEAVGALAGTKDERSGKLILRALRDPALGVRIRAVEAIAARTDLARLRELESCYAGAPETEAVELREEAIKAAAKIQGSEGLLRRALNDPQGSVRDLARRELERRGHSVPPAGEDRKRPTPFLDIFYRESPVVIVETEKGAFEIECYSDDAPVHTAAFVERVRRGFYDGLIFHRLVPNFVVQGGDPRGDGTGSGGPLLRDEINRLRFDRGYVGMPKAGKDTGGCQFFITLIPTPHLDGRYTVFGRVVSGTEVLDRLEEGDKITRAALRRR